MDCDLTKEGGPPVGDEGARSRGACRLPPRTRSRRRAARATGRGTATGNRCSVSLSPMEGGGFSPFRPEFDF